MGMFYIGEMYHNAQCHNNLGRNSGGHLCSIAKPNKSKIIVTTVRLFCTLSVKVLLVLSISKIPGKRFLVIKSAKVRLKFRAYECLSQINLEDFYCL
jgi:hypothetical protein